MNCCGEREKLADLKQEQKWDYVNLDDFKSSSCWAGLAYGYLWIMLFVSISVYVVDTFTAINLLVFDRWSGQIKPKIPLTVSRWIFAGCIIVSFILLVYRWLRAIRVIKQGGVAKSYLDPLAVRLQSIRMGENGKGWKRFLVFAELTKSRKGADYVALFTYFSFEAWLRIVFAEGPRQVVNAITLYSVLQLKLLPHGDPNENRSPIIQFFINIGLLADSNKLQAVILFGMLWTLIIWVISAISLASSVAMYLLFLWHHIPSEDGSLTAYCRRKIDRRMGRIVQAKVDKALKKENELRVRQEARLAREGGGHKEEPTLPDFDSMINPKAGLSRQDTMTTLPEYSSRPPTQADSRENFETAPPVPNFNGMRPGPQRSMTHGSDASFWSDTSNAPLIPGASDMGYAPSERSHTPGTIGSGAWGGRPPPSRSMTGGSQFSQRPFTPGTSRSGNGFDGRNGPDDYPLEPISRTGTSLSNGPRYRQPSEPELVRSYGSDGEYDPNYPPTLSHSFREPTSDDSRGPRSRQMPSDVADSYFPPMREPLGRNSPAPDLPSRSQVPSRGLYNRSFTPGEQPPSRGPVDRSFTPLGQPPSRGPIDRSFTPVGQPPNRGPLDRSFTPTGQPPSRGPLDRSYTPMGPPPSRGPIERSLSPGGQSSSRGPIDRPFIPREPSPSRGPIDRSFTPMDAPPNGGSLGRSFTPAGEPPVRNLTPVHAPFLPRLQTSASSNSGYTPFSPEARSTTPRSAQEPSPSYDYFNRNENGPEGPLLAGRRTPQPRLPAWAPPPRHDSTGPYDLLKRY